MNLPTTLPGIRVTRNALTRFRERFDPAMTGAALADMLRTALERGAEVREGTDARHLIAYGVRFILRKSRGRVNSVSVTGCLLVAERYTPERI